jgi:hypothetical protein
MGSVDPEITEYSFGFLVRVGCLFFELILTVAFPIILGCYSGVLAASVKLKNDFCCYPLAR